MIDLTKHPDPKAALEKVFGELDKLEAVASRPVGEEGIGMAPAPLAAPQQPPELEPPPGAVAGIEEVSDLVAPEPSQPEPQPQDSKRRPVLVPKPTPPAELVTFGFVGFGHEDPDYDERDNWPGPDPDVMPQQAALPRLVVSNAPPEPPEGPSDAELVHLLPTKRPTDNAVLWEIRAHDMLRELRVPWFRAQRLVKQQSSAHNWRAHCPVRLALAKDSP